MKKTMTFLLTAVLAVVTATAYAQTMNVHVGQVTYAFSAAQTGEMTFSAGETLTIQGKTFAIADISSMETGSNTVDDNTVSVTYSGDAATVVVAGNIAKYLTVTAQGADVSILADESLEEEINYTLTGTSTDGSFYQEGSYKCTVTLNGLTLTNADGSPLSIRNGKRISIVVADGTVNTLADGEGDQKGCLYVKGHPELSGTGTLNITGNCRHAFFSGEYTQVKEDFGTLNILASAADGLHVGQYFRMDGGTINVNTANGDGIDVGANLEGEDLDGQMLLLGGTLNVSISGAACKGLKADSTITVSGTATTVTTTGSAYYDAEAADISSAAALKTGGQLIVSSGTLYLTSTGAGGKGINADEDIVFNGGKTTVVTTGDVFKYGSDDSKPQGVKTDGSITINGGELYVAASPKKTTALKPTGALTINGGKVMAIGAKEVTVSGGTQSAQTYSGLTVAGGQTLTLDGVSFDIPAIYSITGAYVLVSGGE